MGDEINAYDEKQEESVLSDLYYNYHPGYVNVRLTELFIKHGFDVKANEGKNGESCLCALCWSSYDHYVLHVAELLFDAGARNRDGYKKDADEYDERGVLNSIEWKFGYWHTGNYDSANMFEAYYLLANRALKGKKYSGIRAFRDCIGKTVLKVERLKEKSRQGDTIRVSYLLHCEDMRLVANDYVEFIVNPYAYEEAIEIEDVSMEFEKIIGTKVRGLRYFNSSLARLSFDNEYALQVGDACNNKDSGSWFKITSCDRGKLPQEGTKIESIKLWGQITHAETVTCYSEDTIVLNTKEETYALYVYGKNYKDAYIRVEMLDKEIGNIIEREVEAYGIVLKHVEYRGHTIKWISCSCNEGFIYIVPDGSTDIAIFMSEFELGSDKIRNNYADKSLKKINIRRG